MRKQLVILSGFLGSGKTTFLRSLLQRYEDRKIAVLLNDFGDIPVDGMVLRKAGVENGVVMEIGGGSVFCSCLREPFVKALIALSQRDEDMVIVEASGMSDPASIDKLLSLSGLSDSFDHVSTICLFDPVKSLKLAHVLEVIPRQLASANVVVLTKIDMTTPEEQKAAQDYIRRQEPDVPILESRDGEVDFTTCPTRVLPAFAFGFNTPENRPDCFSLQSVSTDAERLLNILRNDQNVLRVKGCIKARDGIWFVSDTGKGFEIMPCEEAPTPLMIICMQGTADSVKAALRTVGIECPRNLNIL